MGACQNMEFPFFKNPNIWEFIFILNGNPDVTKIFPQIFYYNFFLDQLK